jgi:hypothetical protein
MGRSPALQATPQNKFHPRADLDQDKKRSGQKNLHHHNVKEDDWRTVLALLSIAASARPPGMTV